MKSKYVVLVFLCSLVFTANSFSFPCSNGVYVSDFWTGKLSKRPNQIEFIQRLTKHNINSLFIKVSSKDIKEQRNIRRSLFRFSRTFSNFNLYAWIGGRVCTINKKMCLDLKNKRSYKNIIGLSKAIWHMGFKGIHLNLEPIKNDNLDFIKLLTELKRVKPRIKHISIAGYMLTLKDSEKELYSFRKTKHEVLAWSRAYYKQILPLINHIVVMNYDTGIKTKKEYIDYTSLQVKNFLGTPKADNLIFNIGIPSYDIGRGKLFDKKVENISSSLEGILKGLAKAKRCPQGFGLAIYKYSETNNSEWETFYKEWSALKRK